MNSETLRQERPKYALLATVFFVACLQPFTWLLAHYLPWSFAFGLAMLAVSLMSYPLALRGGYRPWSWQRNWTFWHFVIFDLAISVTAFLLARVFVGDR